MRILGLLAVLFLLNGCFLFRPAEKTDDGALYTERVSQPRTERQLERKELVLALHDSIESSWEITQIRQVLDREKIRLKIIRLSDRDGLSALVRSGRVDVMAGTFTQKEIRSLHLLPVLPYTGSDGKSQYCFAVRHDDQLLENLLGTEAASGTTEERKQP